MRVSPVWIGAISLAVKFDILSDNNERIGALTLCDENRNSKELLRTYSYLQPSHPLPLHSARDFKTPYTGYKQIDFDSRPILIILPNRLAAAGYDPPSRFAGPRTVPTASSDSDSQQAGRLAPPAAAVHFGVRNCMKSSLLLRRRSRRKKSRQRFSSDIQADSLYRTRLVCIQQRILSLSWDPQASNIGKISP
ncbi:hypothetical protein ACLOJK_014441 [Asimina triloba]